MSEIAIGIDLGTSNSVVSVVINGQATAIPNEEGEIIQPSVVHFAPGGEVWVGSRAKKCVLSHPERTVSSFKRLLGSYYTSEAVRRHAQKASYEVAEGPQRDVRFKIDGHSYSIPEISAYVLRELRRTAEKFLGRSVSKAVITVPAHFNDNQRQATKDACQLVGLEVLKIINEPTAVALAYGYDRALNQRLAVFDMGGGTLDLTILDIHQDIFEVRGTAGDAFLGGDDFDYQVMMYLADTIQAKAGLNLREDRQAMQRLKEYAEWMKMQLSTREEVEVDVKGISSEGKPHSPLPLKLTQSQFNQLTFETLQRSYAVSDEALRSANCGVDGIDGLIMVGGQSRSLNVRAAVEYYFGREAQYRINPDEAVALGAAIHGYQLVNRRRDAMLIDVTPLTLRIGTVGGLTEVVIPKNTPLPVERGRSFVTVSDGQDVVRLRIYQGESREIEYNELLGEFSFSGFRKAPRGDITIQVHFNINTSGMLSVRAIEEESGMAAHTEVSLAPQLSAAELEQMRLDPT